MLRQASLSDLSHGRVQRGRDYVVITMRRYPRFLRREDRDEYHTSMSPEAKLLEDWLTAKRKHDDHDGAFSRSRFEQRFKITEEGLENLRRLSELARGRDVYLVCRCPEGQRCHRELLLMMAKELFPRTRVEKPRNPYPVFARRIRGLRAKLAAKGPRPKPAEPRKKAPSRKPRAPARSRAAT